MEKYRKRKITLGMSVIEVMLATVMFAILATGGIATIVHSFSVNRRGEEETQATLMAQEGIEAVRSIKNKGWSNLSAGTTGVATTGNAWGFDGNPDVNGRFTRTVQLDQVMRNSSGVIVNSGGTVDPDTMKVTSTVTWAYTTGNNENVQLSTYLTNFRKAIQNGRGGMLVYGDGGTTSDVIRYRILDANGLWGTVNAIPDFDTTATNKALRAIRVYASATRNEKIVLSRHFNGTQESIYAHIFNGATWTSSQLSSWTASAYDTANQSIRNYDGQYLSNGSFLVTYSDNSTTPKYRIWNGTAWSPNPPSAGNSVANVGGIPSNMTLRIRPGSNEAMLTVFDQSSDTNTVYFNGTTWSSVTEHATNAPTNTKEFAEFAWSTQNPLKGILIFQTASNDRAMNIKLWTANGSGSGTWTGNNINTSNQGGNLGAMELEGGRRGAEEFLACNKDENNDIYCFRGNTTPAWASPINNIMTTNTHTGIQRSFDLAFDGLTGTEAIVVYSDNSAVPKLKKYDAATNTFDSTATNLTSVIGTLTTVKLKSVSDNNDIMIMLGNTNNDFYTIVWDGSNNQVYTTPTGKGFTAQGTNGSNSTELWYGFAWDLF